ncbi:MAG TPA: hypothetical protein VMI12_15225 [Puia sp.]|nr:hypothetical protein [Puia sp.]
METKAILKSKMVEVKLDWLISVDKKIDNQTEFELLKLVEQYIAYYLVNRNHANQYSISFKWGRSKSNPLLYRLLADNSFTVPRGAKIDPGIAIPTEYASTNSTPAPKGGGNPPPKFPKGINFFNRKNPSVEIPGDILSAFKAGFTTIEIGALGKEYQSY